MVINTVPLDRPVRVSSFCVFTVVIKVFDDSLIPSAPERDYFQDVFRVFFFHFINEILRTSLQSRVF